MQMYTKWRGSGYADVGVKSKIFPLCLKGRFYAIIAFRPKGKILRQSRRSVPNGNILRMEGWRKMPLCYSDR